MYYCTISELYWNKLENTLRSIYDFVESLESKAYNPLIQVIVLFALVALAFAEETKSDETKNVETAKKDKRGLYGALGYGIGGGLGYGLGGLNTYSGLPIGVSHGVSTVLTKEVAVPVPQPVAVPVEKHVPVPVKVYSLFSIHDSR